MRLPLDIPLVNILEQSIPSYIHIIHSPEFNRVQNWLGCKWVKRPIYATTFFLVFNCELDQTKHKNT